MSLRVLDIRPISVSGELVGRSYSRILIPFGEAVNVLDVLMEVAYMAAHFLHHHVSTSIRKGTVSVYSYLPRLHGEWYERLC